MKMALDGADGANLVRSYTPGQVRIRDQTFTRSVIVLPDRVITDWPPDSVLALRSSHFKPVVEAAPEVVILGTGERQVFPDQALFVTLMDLSIGFEVMANDAACRTYNILLAEGRKAALGLLLGGPAD